MNNKDLLSNLDDFLADNSVESLDINTKHESFNNIDNVNEFINSEEFNKYKVSNTQSDTIANYKGATVQDILGLTNLKDDKRLSLNSIEHFDIDIEMYNQILEQSPILQDTLAEGEAILKPFKYLLQDIYLSLIKLNPILMDPNKIHSSVLMNRYILKSIINTPEYITLRKTCQLNEFNSALGSEIIGKEALEIVKEIADKLKQEQKDKINQLTELEEEQDYLLEQNENLEDYLQQMQNAGNIQGAQNIQQMIDENNANLAKARQLANAIQLEEDEKGDYLQLAQDSTQEQVIEGSLIESMMKAEQEIQEDSAIALEWGIGDEKNANLRIGFASKKLAIEKIRKSRKLTDLTDIIGKFKDMAIAEQKKKTKYGAVEIKSVTTGKRIEDVLPSDRMNLANDVTKKDFYRRMTDNQLLVYSKESTNSKNKGPIIMCIDTSGSMSGDREMWSKALAVGVVEIAQLQKRDFACILFSSQAYEPIIIEKNKPDPEKIIQIAEEFDDGGTNFQRPLEKASKLIEDSRFKNADILFVTDGSCDISDTFEKKFNKLKEDKEFRCIGVVIGESQHSYKRYGSTLDSFCDKVITIEEIRDPEKETEINQQIFADL